MEQIYEMSGVKFWSWIFGAFVLGTISGVIVGVIGFIVLMALIG